MFGPPLYLSSSPRIIGVDSGRVPDRTACRLATGGRAGALSDDEAGLVTVMAAALPADVDPADEPALIEALHAQRFAARDIARLAPWVTARVRATRRALLGDCDAGDVIGGLCLLVVLLSFALLGCIFDAETAQAAALAPAAAAAPARGYAPALACGALLFLAAWFAFFALATVGSGGDARPDEDEPLAIESEHLDIRPLVARRVPPTEQDWRRFRELRRDRRDASRRTEALL